MAKPITKLEMKAMEVIQYEKIRDYLQTGQIIFCSGNYLFSGIIQRLTKSAWSHVAIIYKDEQLGRVLVLEAEPYIGIRLIPLSKYIHDYKGTRRPYKGNMFITKFSDPPVQTAICKAISFGLDELTRPYDNWEIVRIMMRILFKIGKREKNRNYICSELVRDCFVKADILFKYHDSYISPDAIWNDERIEMKYRIL